VVLLNLGFAIYQLRFRRDALQAIIWVAVAGLFLVHAIAYFVHAGWMLPQGFRDSITRLMGMMGGQLGPILYVTGAVVAFIIFLRFRAFLTEPLIAWGLLDLGLLASGWSMTDPNFRLIITKEDNVPIVMLIFTVGFFTWLAFRKAVLNDER